MENQEMVMEKSWKNIMSSLWEPCQRILIGWIPSWTNRLAVTKVVSMLANQSQQWRGPGGTRDLIS